MILNREIEEKSRKYDVRITTVERDYGQYWILAHVKKLNMALKGGTGIRKVFIKDYRFSDDLDFTLMESYEKETLEDLLIDAVLEAKEESGIQFQDTIKLTPTESGFTTKVIFIGIKTGSPIGIKIDLTLAENETIFLPTQERIIIHEYSDDVQKSVKSYALEEIVAEKIRALFQRARARDVYDIWQLANIAEKEVVQSILERKLEKKDLAIDMEVLIQKKDILSSAWKTQLVHQMREVPNFDEIFNEVLVEVKYYEMHVKKS